MQWLYITDIGEDPKSENMYEQNNVGGNTQLWSKDNVYK